MQLIQQTTIFKSYRTHLLSIYFGKSGIVAKQSSVVPWVEGCAPLEKRSKTSVVDDQVYLVLWTTVIEFGLVLIWPRSNQLNSLKIVLKWFLVVASGNKIAWFEHQLRAFLEFSTLLCSEIRSLARRRRKKRDLPSPSYRNSIDMVLVYFVMDQPSRTLWLPQSKITGFVTGLLLIICY